MHSIDKVVRDGIVPIFYFYKNAKGRKFILQHPDQIVLRYTPQPLITQFVRLHVIPWAAHIPPHIPQFCSYTHSQGLVRTARIHRSRPQYFYAVLTRMYPLSAAFTAQKSAADCAAVRSNSAAVRSYSAPLPAVTVRTVRSIL
jgi:hypothetical protein